jgi:MFS family permease
MNLEVALPSSLGLEIEARRLHARDRSFGRLVAALGGALGVFPQALDAIVWAIVATMVFPATVFAGDNPPIVTVGGAGLWLIAYLVAPFGAWICGRLARRHGRGVALTAARFTLGLATAAVAFLPLAHAPEGVVLLVASRLVQGLALGALCLGREGRARSAASWAIASVAGAAFAGALFWGFRASLAPADLLEWGWRYAFVLALPINTVALFADLRLLSAGGASPRLVSVDGARVDRPV